MELYISQRALGRLPISLPTSIAIETILGLNENQPNDSIKGKKEIWINISTLIRNLYSSLDKETQSIVSDNELANTVIDEMEIIDSAIKEFNGKLTVKYYLAHYHRLYDLYPKAIFRERKTEKQKFNAILLDNAARNIKQVDTSESIRIYDLNIEPLLSPEAVMLTHNVVDLTSDIYFKDLVLLESHTGKLKTKKDWYTKLSASDKSPLLPFNRTILSIFGDSEIFRPQPVRYRRVILETAEKFNWSFLTTLERMRLTLGYHPDKEIAGDIIKNIR